MRKRQGHALTMLRGVQAFIDRNAVRVPMAARSGTRRRLDEIVAKLSAHATDQVESDLAARGSTKKQEALKTVLLRDHMTPIARIARAALIVTPELRPLKMPRGKPGAPRLAVLAHGMAIAAAPFADTFIAYGRNEDFLEELDAAADAMLGATNARTQNRARRGSATKGLEIQLARGRRAVDVLDGFVQKDLRHDHPRLLAAWKIVKRVHR